MIAPTTLHILSKGHTLGTGFLIAKDLVVTCAHVIAASGETIQVQFKGRDEKLSARVIPEYRRELDNGDIAFLRLESIPENITLLRLRGGAGGGRKHHRRNVVNLQCRLGGEARENGFMWARCLKRQCLRSKAPDGQQ